MYYKLHFSFSLGTVFAWMMMEAYLDTVSFSFSFQVILLLKIIENTCIVVKNAHSNIIKVVFILMHFMMSG